MPIRNYHFQPGAETAEKHIFGNIWEFLWLSADWVAQIYFGTHLGRFRRRISNLEPNLLHKYFLTPSETVAGLESNVFPWSIFGPLANNTRKRIWQAILGWFQEADQEAAATGGQWRCSCYRCRVAESWSPKGCRGIEEGGALVFLRIQ